MNRLGMPVGVLLMLQVLTGCKYLQDRGNDAKDMIDIGVTVT